MTPSDLIDFVTGTTTPGTLDVSWIHGEATDPPIQTHQYDEHTVILRQSKTTHYEAPFLFLLFGNDRALLLDTGAIKDPAQFPLRSTVDGLITTWLDRHPRDEYELIVAHTHGHGDHVAADEQFTDRPATTVVPRDVDGVRSFFGFGDRWPAHTVEFDLGGRVLQILGSPGHHPAAITIYDPWTGILFTGDTVLPGRLYISDHAAFTATLQRLVAFADTHTVTHILGCHIEMTRKPRRDYPIGATYQPDERALQMTVSQLKAVGDAAASVTGQRGVHRFDDFIVYNEPRKRDVFRLLARGRLHKTRTAVLRRLRKLGPAQP